MQILTIWRYAWYHVRMLHFVIYVLDVDHFSTLDIERHVKRHWDFLSISYVTKFIVSFFSSINHLSLEVKQFPTHWEFLTDWYSTLTRLLYHSWIWLHQAPIVLKFLSFLMRALEISVIICMTSHMVGDPFVCISVKKKPAQLHLIVSFFLGCCFARIYRLVVSFSTINIFITNIKFILHLLFPCFL